MKLIFDGDGLFYCLYLNKISQKKGDCHCVAIADFYFTAMLFYTSDVTNASS